jgi:hypothetical protein
VRILFLAFMLAGQPVLAASVSFAPRELFRVPFGTDREALASKLDGDNLLIPRDFTMDGAGHFYIYDTNNHRIARYSLRGKYEIGFNYPATAGQVFAHADSKQNLWLLISDPIRGVYYGVYDAQGKSLRSGIFSRFDHYRLHLDDDATLHVILSSSKDPATLQTYILDEPSLLMKKEKVAPPPENHHQVRRSDHVYFIDQVPDGSKEDSAHVNRVTDETHRGIADIQGTVTYVTERGDVYARVNDRDINVYDVVGSQLGKVKLAGLAAACASVRYDASGNIYELDGIPDDQGHYTAAMPGMRLVVWERQ